MRLKLLSIAFVTTCLLFMVPAYADSADDVTGTPIGTAQGERDSVRIASAQDADNQGMQTSGDTGQGLGPASNSDSASDPDLDPVLPPSHPVDEAPGTVDGNQAAVSKTETKTETVKIDKKDMHRLYNPNSGEHFYTADLAERNNLIRLGWKYEGIGWMAPVESDYPVFRLYNPNAGDHHYTLDVKERDHLRSVGWIFEGIGWYSALASEGKSVLRQYNPNAVAGAHNFTVDASENQMLVRAGWRAEGVGWYALVSDTKNVQTSTDTVIEEAPYLTATFTTARGETPETVVSYGKKNETYLFLPSYASLESIYLSARTAQDRACTLMLAGKGAYVTVDPRSPMNLLSLGVSRDANGTLKLSFKTSLSKTVFPLIVMQSANVSTIYINSNDIDAQGRDFIESSKDHSAKANVVVRMLDQQGGVIYDEDSFGSDKKKLSTIKGRGNSTWANGIKKPYQISLSKKTDLIGTDAAAKKWILLANSADASLIHSSVAFDLAAELGLATVDVRPVDLYYDGEYRGSYLLTEKIEIGTGRVDIFDLEEEIDLANPGVELDKQPVAKATNVYGNEYQYVTGVNDPADISGGYLLELDCGYYATELCWFSATWPGAKKKVYFVLKSPEVTSKNAVAFISEAVQEALNNFANDKLADGAALVDGTYAFDLDSFAKMYLLEEFLKNNDAYTSSTYFTLDKGSKVIYSGPVWDFDAGMGTRTDANDSMQSSYWGYFLDTYRMLATPSVKKRVQEIYADSFRDLIANVVLGSAQALGPLGKLHSITAYASQITASQRMNEIPFGVTSFDFQAKPFSTWKLNVEYFAKWLQCRLQWLDGNIAELGNVTLTGNTSANRWSGGFDYGLVFDYQYYLEKNPDLVAAGIKTPQEALEHFVTFGMHESNRIGTTARNFNVKAYMDKNPELKKSLGTDMAAYYRHYCTKGFKEGLVCW